MYRQYGVCCAILLGVGGIAGCSSGSGEVPRAIVHGKVTYQGKPVETGIITFIPGPNVSGSSVQLVIHDGQYDSHSDPVDSRGVVVGENQIQILATRKTGKQVQNPNNELEDEVIQYIPEKYNTATELQRDVQSGNNEFDFEL